MKKVLEKLNKVFISTLIMVFVMIMPTFCIWGKTEKGGIFWVNSDNTYEKDGWKLIDDDNDGIGHYYYFNENGFILLDDITPDYMVVNKEGKRIDIDGNVVSVKIENISMEEGDVGEYSEEILAQIAAENTIVTGTKGLISDGGQIISVDKDEEEGPRPSDNLVIDVNPDGTARWLLGPNVTLKKKTESRYDPTMDKNMAEYIKSSDKFSKSVNGTTFTKSKWKAAMALKGNGATVVFENPKHNFNKLKGRIATHYFTYSERETSCTLNIYNEDNSDLLYSTSAFNYNAGCAFECTFYQAVSAIRFELEVSGQYTSRVCYLRNCEFGFDREVWEDEQYEKEVEEAHIAIYGTDSEAEYVEEEEEEKEEEKEDEMGERSVEGEDPGVRYRRINGIADDAITIFDYDEDDDTITEAMRASISELKKKMEEEQEKKNQVSGPAFDEELKKAKPVVGPDGSTNIYEAFADEDG